MDISVNYSPTFGAKVSTSTKELLFSKSKGQLDELLERRFASILECGDKDSRISYVFAGPNIDTFVLSNKRAGIDEIPLTSVESLKEKGLAKCFLEDVSDNVIRAAEKKLGI